MPGPGAAAGRGHSGIGCTAHACLANAARSGARGCARAGIGPGLITRIGSGGTHGRTPSGLSCDLNLLPDVRPQLVEVAGEPVDRSAICSQGVVGACCRAAQTTCKGVAGSSRSAHARRIGLTRCRAGAGRADARSGRVRARAGSALRVLRRGRLRAGPGLGAGRALRPNRTGLTGLRIARIGSCGGLSRGRGCLRVPARL